MIRGETIVCISPTSWFDIWRNRQQVMSRLAQQNRIVFVQPRDQKNADSDIPPNIDILFAPREFPFMSRFLPEFLLRWTTPFVVKLNNFILSRYLKKKLSQLGIVEPILWVYEPLYVWLLGNLGEKLTCWHVHDETSEFPFNLKIANIIHSCEEILGQNVDLIFASSKYQYNKRRVYGDKVHFVPNACDYYHFEKILSYNDNIPADISHIRHPIIGYYGNIHFTVDINLVCYISERRPKFSVVLVGQDDFLKYSELKKLNRNKNIHCLGFKNYNEIPSYVKIFDVVIFPYKLNSMLYAIPLKLYECLAACKAIVSTPLPELLKLEGLIWIARSPEDFVSQIEDALERKDDLKRIEDGQRLAQKNDWDQRVEQMSKLMFHALSNRVDRR